MQVLQELFNISKGFGFDDLIGLIFITIVLHILKSEYDFMLQKREEKYEIEQRNKEEEIPIDFYSGPVLEEADRYFNY